MNEKDMDFPTTVDDTITDTDGGGTVPATVPAQPLINPFVHFRQRNSGGGGFFRGPLIKLNHNTGEFWRSRGGVGVKVAPGERFIINPHEMVDTWTKFIDGKSVDRRVYRTVDGEFAPEREALGDNDENEWPTKNLKPKDPWQRQVFLPMKGADGEVCAFSATGQSAIGEVGEIVGMFGSADRHGKFPVVELETRSFESQHRSTVYVPVFRLVDWQFWEADKPAPPVAPVPIPTAPPPKAIAKREADTTDDDDMSDTAPARKAVTKSSKRGDLDDDIPFIWAAIAAIPLLAALSGLGGLFA